MNSKKRVGAPRTRRAAPIAYHPGYRRLLTMIVLPASIVLACHSRNELREELRTRGSNDGLAIIRPRTNWFEIVSFTAGVYNVRNPRGLSSAWIAQGGQFVAWNIHPRPGGRIDSCPSATTIETVTGDLIWQVPGSITNIRAMALSPDGQRLAFEGTYASVGMPISEALSKPVTQTTGLHYVDHQNGRVVRVSLHPEAQYSSGWISWSPSSDAFAYANVNRIYVLYLSTGISKFIGDGQNPTWSPDGKGIAFKSRDGWPTVIDPVTLVSRRLPSQHRILGAVHWSPNSEYVLVSESLSSVSNLLNWRSPIFGPSAELVVYRLRDEARLSVDFINFKGGDDRGFSWIKNLDSFLKGAARWPLIQPCLPELTTNQARGSVAGTDEEPDGEELIPK